MMIPLVCAHCGANFERTKKIVDLGKRRRGARAKFYCGYSCSSAAIPRRKRQSVIKRYRAYQVDGRWVYEHREVMEKVLGRKLTTDEHVHHINGIKYDNRRKNLVVLSKEEHGRLHRTCHL